MKAYTDIEQSRKLAEILPLESADMYYSTWTIVSEDGEFIVSVNQQGETIEDLQKDYGNQVIPCWSLAALLSLMPRIEYVKPFIDLGPNLDSEEVAIYYNSGDCPYIVRDNLVDACYELICWLEENGEL